jgi:hypothetical protein
MKITLNGNELPRKAEGDMQVADVLRELRDEINASGKLLVRVILDGFPLADGWMNDDRVRTSASTVNHLELLIAEPRQLAQSLLNDSSEVIKKLTSKTSELARKFRVGNEINAHTELAEFLDDLKLVVSGLDLTTRQTAQIQDMSEIRSRVEASASQLIPALSRIQRAQSAGDRIALADEIQYELPGQINQWRSLVEEAQHIVEATCQKA